MSDGAIRVHLERLVMMEYVRAAAGRNGLRFEYELLFDGDAQTSAPQMIGLIDINQLGTTMATSQGAAPDLAPPAGRSHRPCAGPADCTKYRKARCCRSFQRHRCG